jgi:predicted choloylglycine hydrolase
VHAYFRKGASETYHSRVSGTYYEMGFRYGSLLFKHGVKLQLSETNSQNLTFGKECEKEVKRIFPDVLDEIRGLAEAFHISYERLSSFIFSIGVSKPTACSVFATFNGSDVIFGRNYDFFYRFKKHSESFVTVPANGYVSVGNSDIFIGREDGVNEKGLAVAMTFVAPKQVKPGINFALLARCLLDKCSNVKEAVKTLSDVHTLCANCYLIADKEGDMAVIEACPNKIRIRKPEKNDSFIVCTNQFMHPEMFEMENQKERPSDSSHRYTTIYEALKQRSGRIDAKTAQKILSNHDGYVCSHIESIQLGTLWSMIATLKKPSIYIAEGHPCRAKYKLDTRLSKP